MIRIMCSLEAPDSLARAHIRRGGWAKWDAAIWRQIQKWRENWDITWPLQGQFYCQKHVYGHIWGAILLSTHFNIIVYVFCGCCSRSSGGCRTLSRSSIGNPLATAWALLVLYSSLVTVGHRKQHECAKLTSFQSSCHWRENVVLTFCAYE